MLFSLDKAGDHKVNRICWVFFMDDHVLWTFVCYPLGMIWSKNLKLSYFHWKWWERNREVRIESSLSCYSHVIAFIHLEVELAETLSCFLFLSRASFYVWILLQPRKVKHLYYMDIHGYWWSQRASWCETGNPIVWYISDRPKLRNVSPKFLIYGRKLSKTANVTRWIL